MHQPLNELLGRTDIYLVDQIMKGLYTSSDRLLDAGCGHGRNLHWFVQNNIEIFGTDADAEALAAAAAHYPDLASTHLMLASCEALPFKDAYFDHVICSAVLHFANSEVHFLQMMKELLRVLKPGGTLFIRMASVFGMEQLLTLDVYGQSILPDGSQRFLLTSYLLEAILSQCSVQLAEPIKTTIVHGQRCMTTLLFAKQIVPDR